MKQKFRLPPPVSPDWRLCQHNAQYGNQSAAHPSLCWTRTHTNARKQDVLCLQERRGWILESDQRIGTYILCNKWKMRKITSHHGVWGMVGNEPDMENTPREEGSEQGYRINCREAHRIRDEGGAGERFKGRSETFDRDTMSCKKSKSDGRHLASRDHAKGRKAVWEGRQHPNTLGSSQFGSTDFGHSTLKRRKARPVRLADSPAQECKSPRAQGPSSRESSDYGSCAFGYERGASSAARTSLDSGQMDYRHDRLA